MKKFCLSCLFVASAIVGTWMPHHSCAAEVAAHARLITDACLQPGGTLIGAVVDASGQPVRNAELRLRELDRETARATTDTAGRFRIANLQSGVCQVIVSGQSNTLRLWQPDVAPPAAADEVLIVLSGEILRGQQRAGQFFRSDAFLIGAAALAAILIPIEILDARREQPPGS